MCNLSNRNAVVARAEVIYDTVYGGRRARWRGVPVCKQSNENRMIFLRFTESKNQSNKMLSMGM